MGLSSGSLGPLSIFHRWVTNSTNSRGGCWRPAFHCSGPPFNCARSQRPYRAATDADTAAPDLPGQHRRLDRHRRLADCRALIRLAGCAPLARCCGCCRVRIRRGREHSGHGRAARWMGVDELRRRAGANGPLGGRVSRYNFGCALTSSRPDEEMPMPCWPRSALRSPSPRSALTRCAGRRLRALLKRAGRPR
jgi:hypothetical protein